MNVGVYFFFPALIRSLASQYALQDQGIVRCNSTAQTDCLTCITGSGDMFINSEGEAERRTLSVWPMQHHTSSMCCCTTCHVENLECPIALRTKRTQRLPNLPLCR